MGKKGGGGGSGRSRGSSKSSSGSPFGATSIVFVVVAAAAVYGYKQWAAKRDAEALGPLRKLLSRRGAKLDSVVPTSFDYGGFWVRGLGATQAVPEGGVVLSVPRELIFADFTADSDVIALVQKITGKNPHDPVQARDLAVAAGLLREKALKGKSDFAAYLESMPQPGDLLNLPLWDEAQLNALSSIPGQYAIWRNMMLRQLEDVVDADEKFFGYPEPEEFSWALSMVLSRQVEGMLMPIIDLANHRFAPNSKMHCDDAGCRLHARRRIDAGEEVTITYGSKPNLHLLQAYAFSVSGNELRALRLDRWAASAGLDSKACSSPSLEHSAPLGVNASGLECFEKALGRCKMLETLAEECRQTTARLLPPAGEKKATFQKALGIVDARTALAELDVRQPVSPIDGQLKQAIEGELETLKLCAEKAEAEFGSLKAAGSC